MKVAKIVSLEKFSKPELTCKPLKQLVVTRSVGLLLRPLTDILIMSNERAHSLGGGQRAAVQCADSSLYLRLWVVTIPCCGGGGSSCWKHQVVFRQAIKHGLQRSADLSIEGSLLTKLHVGEGFVDKCPNYIHNTVSE